jgi:hypothetical protein
MSSVQVDDRVEHRGIVLDQNDILGLLGTAGDPGMSGLAIVFWRALDKGVDWFVRRSGIPREEVYGWLWLWVHDHPSQIASAWNAAGEAGLVNAFSTKTFRYFPDYRHHEYEIPFSDHLEDDSPDSECDK